MMKTKISEPSFSALEYARELIERGEVVAFHTETVYGLGANALDDEAVLKIFRLKGRPSNNPLIVHVNLGYDISALIDGEPDYAPSLRRTFLPGPLTMVYPSTGKVSKYVSCGLNTLAIRVPRSETAQAFLKAVGLPIAAPSANLSKHVSPVSAAHVYDDFAGKIPLILDGGSCLGGIESTVLDCTGKIPMILREGLITREMIAKVAGDCGLYHRREGEPPKSPGMAYKHYSPRCRTAFCREKEEAIALYEEERRQGGRPVILCESGLFEENHLEILELGATDAEMAQRLYALLREGEKRASLLIGIEPMKKGGVMAGVLNRLHRAFGESDDDESHEHN